MSVSVSVRGVRDQDGKLKDMIALALQCRKLEIEYPMELIDYFADTEALCMKPEAMAQEATEISVNYTLASKIPGLVAGDVEYGDGMTIDLTKLPDDIKALRIFMS